jgi:hypothetical protein
MLGAKDQRWTRPPVRCVSGEAQEHANSSSLALYA